MVRKTVRVKNPAGLLLQSAGRLCDEAARYDAKVSFVKGNMTSDAKSLLAVLGACIQYGDEVEFICEGAQEEEALDAMVRMTEEI